MAEWICPRCSAHNAGNFCTACGQSAPQANSQTEANVPQMSGQQALTQQPLAQTQPQVQPGAQTQRPQPQAQQPQPQAQPQQPQAQPGAQAQQPQFPSRFKTDESYRIHKSYVWLGPLTATILFVLILLANSISAIIEVARAIERGTLQFSPVVGFLILVGSIALLYALMVGLYALAYRNMSYVFEDREFSFYSGIITKRRVHIPYTRVQSVNHRAGIVQRIAGVCTVTIDTAGGAANKAVRVPYLSLGVAEGMRVELFMRKAATAAGMEWAVVYDPTLDPTLNEGIAVNGAAQSSVPLPPQQMQPAFAGAPVAPGAAPQQSGDNILDSTVGELNEWRGVFGGAVAGLEPVSFERKLNNSELVLTSVSHSMPLVVAVAIGLSIVVTFGGIILGDAEAAAFMGPIFALITIGSTLLSYFFGVLSIAISYGGFSVRRRGSRIEVERGLLQRVFSGIDVDRVQSIEIRQSFIRRLLGYCEVSLGRIGAASESGSNSNSNSNLDARGLVIHPFVKVDKVDEIIDGLIPELADRPHNEQLQGLASVATRRALVRGCLLYNGALWTVVVATVGMLLINQFFVPSTRTVRQFVEGLGPGYVVLVIVCVLITAAAAVHAVLWARHSGYAITHNYVAIRNDGLSTQFVIVPRQKIQSGNTRSNPFQRRLDLATMVVTTAAGTSSTSTRLLDVSQAEGDAYLEWLKPRHVA